MAEKRPYKKNTPSQVSGISGLDLGKVPPQALDLEEAVLGAIMIERDAVIVASEILKSECFYKDSHQRIYRAIEGLYTRHEPVDLYTVTQELHRNSDLQEVGGAVFLAQLTARVGSAAHLEFHAKIVAQKYIQRELIRVSSEIQVKAFDESVDVDDLLDYSEMELFKVSEGNIKRESQSIAILVKQALNNIKEAGEKPDNLSGVPSGFTNLDRLTSGWQPSDLVIIAARPSMGKTAFVLSMARNMAVEHSRSVAFFSLEMSSIQLVNRLIVSETGIPSEKIKTGRLDPDEVTQLTSKLDNLRDSKIFIDDTPALSIFEFRAKCRRLKTQHDIGIIIIDYLQLMTGPTETKGNREQEVSTISRSLKAIAKELNVPIIALSQLNRSVETRGGNKRPQLSDLRESGAIEQDADLVIFIHRPEYYGFKEDEEGNSYEGIAEIIVAKHRNGKTDDIRLRFRNELAKFTDEEEAFYPVYSATDSQASKSVTLGSKMNSDPLAATHGSNDFDFLTSTKHDDEVPY
jgi:replicative DNA helicase